MKLAELSRQKAPAAGSVTIFKSQKLQRQLSIPFSATLLLRLSSRVPFFTREVSPHRNRKKHYVLSYYFKL
jgi:hypothetical protein